jgi:hypothetical protein
MKHRHHIVPKHAGGTDDLSNIIELSVEEHAQAHKELYEKYGRWQDKCAWLGLSEQIGNDEILQMTSSNGGYHGNKGIAKSKEHRDKISEATKLQFKSEEAREKLSFAMMGNNNSKNHRSEEYKKKQSEAMKKAWATRKKKSV